MRKKKRFRCAGSLLLTLSMLVMLFGSTSAYADTKADTTLKQKDVLYDQEGIVSVKTASSSTDVLYSGSCGDNLTWNSTAMGC